MFWRATLRQRGIPVSYQASKKPRSTDRGLKTGGETGTLMNIRYVEYTLYIR